MKITTRYRQLVIAACAAIMCVSLWSFATSSAQPLGAGNPAIELVKVADPTLIQSGGTVVYTYGITNTGDVPLTNVVLSDDKLGDIDLLPSRVTIGLQVLYTFQEGSGTTVHDVSGVDPPLGLTVENGAAVEWMPAGGLSINSSTIVASAGAATKIIDACKTSDEISIEAWVKPANTTQDGPARIVTLSDGSCVRDFTLAQEEGTYDTRLRTTATNDNGIPSLTAGAVNTDELSHVVYTRDISGVARFYVNTVEVGSRNDITGDFSNWDDDFRFALANEFGADRTWLGEYHLVAIYNRALSPAEVSQNFEAKAGVVLLPGESVTATASSAPLYVDTTNTAIVMGTDPDGGTVSDTDTATVTVAVCETGSFEPDDVIYRANRITATVSAPQCHYFEEPYDEDWVKFWAWAGLEYTIETFGLSTFNDTELWLFGPDGNELGHNLDHGGTPASRIDWTAPASGTYFVKVAHEKGWGGGGYFYFLQVIESHPYSDVYEPDNTMDEATPITVGMDQAHTFHGPCGGDVDWVKFNATTDTTYTIQTFGLSGDNDTVLRLYDAGGNEVASDDDDPDYPFASRIDWTATNGGTYFVEVVHFNRFADGDLSYSLKVAIAEDPPASVPSPGYCADAFEPDDAWHDANRIEVNGGLQERSFDVQYDEDWVKFWAFIGNEYTIRTSDLPEGNDTELYLYDADLKLLAYNDDEYLGSGHSLITWSVSETGAYFVKVKHPKSEGGCDFTYSLEVTSSVPCVDVYEDDDTPQDAKPITVDDDLPQSHNFHVPCVCGGERAADEVDWVWFQAEEGVVYTIRTSGLGGGNDTLLELYSVGILYDPELPPLAVNDDYDADDLLPSRIAWEAPDDGKYYVKVLPFDDRHGGCDVGYDLEVNTDELTIIIVGNGSVTATPEPPYHYGEVVTLEAEADLGWTFDRWSGDLDLGTVVTSTTVDITMDRGKIVTATFTQDEYALTIIPYGPGSVTKNPDEETYHYGDVVTLTAIPDDPDDGTLTEWSGDLLGTDNPVTITVHSSMTITAVFAVPEPHVYHAYLPIVFKPCACQDTHEPDQYEDYMNWPALESGEPFESYICWEDIHLENGEPVERDWYWFKIDELYDIEVDLDVPDTVNYDLFLWVGDWVREEDTGRGVDEHIEWSAKGIGYYVVVVKSIGDSDNCTPYELTVTLKPQ